VTRRALITSTANDRLKAVRRLARRRADDLFLIEGHRQLRAALDGSRAAVREVYAAPELFLGPRDGELVARAESQGARVVELGRAAFASISRQVRPDGLAAVAERWPTSLSTLQPGPSPLLLVTDAIERPGNLGTIVRSACAAGATALLVCDGKTDLFHPETVRGSVGALFHLPVAESNTADTLVWLRDHEARVVVASPDGERVHWEPDYAGPTAIVVGGERHGVSRTWIDAADATVAIPMPGPADSLNVAVAAGILLFEAVRRRALACR
jgi:RNA methyltransferase, TrmH family